MKPRTVKGFKHNWRSCQLSGNRIACQERTESVRTASLEGIWKYNSTKSTSCDPAWMSKKCSFIPVLHPFMPCWVMEAISWVTFRSASASNCLTNGSIRYWKSFTAYGEVQILCSPLRRKIFPRSSSPDKGHQHLQQRPLLLLQWEYEEGESMPAKPRHCQSAPHLNETSCVPDIENSVPLFRIASSHCKHNAWGKSLTCQWQQQAFESNTMFKSS